MQRVSSLEIVLAIICVSTHSRMCMQPKTLTPAPLQVEVRLTPGGQAAAAAAAGIHGLAPVIVRATQLVLAKTRELRSDVALARLEMLRSELLFLCGAVAFGEKLQQPAARAQCIHQACYAHRTGQDAS